MATGTTTHHFSRFTAARQTPSTRSNRQATLSHPGLLFIGLFLLLLAGCSTQKAIVTRDDGPAIDGNNLSIDRILVMSAAKEALGTPYRWGGTTPSGYDCSGLVQMAYGKIGISLPRTSNEQFHALDEIDVARPGDLLFFGSGNRATHVGIYMGDRQMIHAPGSGRTVSVSSLDIRYWRQHYLGAAAPAN
ncbi:C40 family peptidase [Salinicola sp. LHM]|uniref:C40 family peptidase n=1 Tax=Salinicola sp. LHM TaxID=3065298 RepID=UPI002ACDA12C|nr:C40 family peptidase [Salinicola sp. LHM]WQH32707.1 C40 family peptidase [Salinicola sp. LHM]